jgi:hypothetical protein
MKARPQCTNAQAAPEFQFAKMASREAILDKVSRVKFPHPRTVSTGMFHNPVTRNDALARRVEWLAGLKTRKATMSRRNELLKLAELFRLQASRARTPAVKQTLRRMGQHYQNEAAHASDRGAERQRRPKQLNRYPEQAA